jgi:hypothetical protein
MYADTSFKKQVGFGDIGIFWGLKFDPDFLLSASVSFIEVSSYLLIELQYCSGVKSHRSCGESCLHMGFVSEDASHESIRVCTSRARGNFDRFMLLFKFQ